jgi:hypothetical protein
MFSSFLHFSCLFLSLSFIFLLAERQSVQRESESVSCSQQPS